MSYYMEYFKNYDPKKEKLIPLHFKDRYYLAPTKSGEEALDDDEAARRAITGKTKIYPVDEQTAIMVGRRNLGLDSAPAPAPRVADTQNGGVEDLLTAKTSSPILNPEEKGSIGGIEETLITGTATPGAEPPASSGGIDEALGIKGPVPSPKEYLQEVKKEPVETAPVGDVFEEALKPITRLPKVYKKEVEESLKMMKEGYDLLGEGVLGTLGGVGMMGLGALGYIFSPITAVERSLVGKPVEGVTGSETAGMMAETATDLAVFGVPAVRKAIVQGLKRVGVTLGSSRNELIKRIGEDIAAIGSTNEGARAVAETLKRLSATGQPVPPRLVGKLVDPLLPKEERVGGIWGNLWEIIELPFTKRYIPTLEGKKSLAEIFQPAVERLPKEQQKAFRYAHAKKQLVMEAGKELGKDLQKLGPKDRYEVLKGLAGESVESKPAKKVLSKYRNTLKSYSLGDQYIDAFKKEFEKQLSKVSIPDLDNPLVRADVEQFLDSVERMFKGKTHPSQILKGMVKIFADPNVSDDLKVALRSLYNLPASTPEAVAEASAKASRALMLSKLVKSGAVSDVPKAGYELVKTSGYGGLPTFAKELGGKYVPRDVWLELLAWQNVAKHSNIALNKWFMSPWKTAKVVLRPATHARNMISNLILNDLGGLPFYRVDVYKQALEELKSKGRYYKEFRNLTGVGGTFTENEIVQLGKGMMLRYEKGEVLPANMFDKALSIFDKVVAPVREMYNAEEQWFKLAKYMHNRKKGLDKYEAAVDAMQWTMNYGEVTRATAALRSTLMPFATWQSKALPLVAKAVKEHPMRVAKWFGIYEGLQLFSLHNHGMGEEEWQYLHSILPSYLADGQFLLVPFRDEKGRLQLLNLTYMVPGFGDFTEMTNEPWRTIFAAPFISLGSALVTKRQFNGMPLYYDWEAPETKAAKALSYVWDQLGPSWMGGSDRILEKIHQMWTDHPDAPTAIQLLGQQLGFKIHAIDEAKALRRREALERIQLSELQVDLTKKIQDAMKYGKDDEDIRRMVENYALLRQKIVQPKESVGLTTQTLKLLGW